MINKNYLPFDIYLNILNKSRVVFSVDRFRGPYALIYLFKKYKMSINK